MRRINFQERGREERRGEERRGEERRRRGRRWTKWKGGGAAADRSEESGH